MPERNIVIVCTIQCSGEPCSPFVLCANIKQAVGAFIGRPPWWYCLLIHITFDVMKIMYSILHAMRAIVCIAHERANTVLPYKIAVTLWYLYSLFLSQCLCLYLAGVQWTPLLDCTNNYNNTLGHDMFLTLQTIFTNWERWLTVKLSRPRQCMRCRGRFGFTRGFLELSYWNQLFLGVLLL